MILGTPLYLSPEQAAGRASGPAADLYSLGATLYHLIAGHPPFQSTSALDVIVRHAIEPPPPLPPDVPAPVARLIGQLLEKDPARRPPDYATVIGALDRLLEGGRRTRRAREHEAGRRGARRRLSASLLAAARGALELGRPKRAHALLEPVVRERGGGWVQAAFLLANSLEESGELDRRARAARGGRGGGADRRRSRARALVARTARRARVDGGAVARRRHLSAHHRHVDVTLPEDPARRAHRPAAAADRRACRGADGMKGDHDCIARAHAQLCRRRAGARRADADHPEGRVLRLHRRQRGRQDDDAPDSVDAPGPDRRARRDQRQGRRRRLPGGAPGDRLHAGSRSRVPGIPRRRIPRILRGLVRLEGRRAQAAGRGGDCAHRSRRQARSVVLGALARHAAAAVSGAGAGPRPAGAAARRADAPDSIRRRASSSGR